MIDKLDDKEFDIAVDKAMHEFGVEVANLVEDRKTSGRPPLPGRDTSPARHKEVITELKAEIERQRPNAERILGATK